MEFGLIHNTANRKLVKRFVEKELSRRNASERRKKDAYKRLKIIFNEIAPNKDLMKWSKKDSESLAIKLVERYKSYWSILSYFQIIRQLIRYSHNLEDNDKLAENYKPLKTPKRKSYKDIYRSENKIISPEQAFELVEKNAKNKKEAFVFMLLLDLGLRPHELLRSAKKKNIRVDELQHYHFKVDDKTKTGAREPMLVFSIPYVQDYIKTLNDEDYLFPFSDQILWRTIKKITEGKCCPYDLRASSMSYYGLFLTDQELKARYGSEEFKHYVKLSKSKLASKLDRLAGREVEGNGDEANLEKIAPKFCVNCKNYSKHNSSFCVVCNKSLNVAEEMKKKIYDEIAYSSYFKLKEIDPKRIDEIALSVAKKYGASLKKI